MLSDVVDPQPVRRESVELPVHQVDVRDDAAQTFHSRRPGKTVDACQTRDYRYEPRTDFDPHPERQLGLNSTRTVCPARGSVHGLARSATAGTSECMRAVGFGNGSSRRR